MGEGKGRYGWYVTSDQNDQDGCLVPLGMKRSTAGCAALVARSMGMMGRRSPGGSCATPQDME